MNWYLFVQKFFGIFFATGIALGLFFPDTLIVLADHSLLILGIVMTMTFLTIDLDAALHNLKRLHVTGIVILITKALVPFVLFHLTRPLGENISIAVLLLSLTPFAAISPTLAKIVGGDAEFILIQQILQTLISPLYMPFLFMLIAGSSINIDVMSMVRILVFLVLIPFGISIFVRLTLKKFMLKTRKFYPAISILLISVLLSGLLASAAEPIKADPLKALPLAGWAFALAIVLMLLGWFVFFFLDKKKRLGIVVAHVYPNIGLTAVLAAGFFGPEVLLFVLIYELPANLLPSIVSRIKLFCLDEPSSDSNVNGE